MEVGRGELDLDPLLVLVLAVEVLEQSAVITRRHLEACEMPFQRRPQFDGQAFRELLVILVDEPILVTHRKGIRHPHADVLIGADHLARTGLDLGKSTGQPTMQMLHCGDTRRDHLEGGIECVEIEIDAPAHQPGHEPEFERHVG
jgi:hypothetical protein